MVKILSFCALAVVLLGTAGTPEPYVPVLEVGATVPWTSLVDQDGKPFSFPPGDGRASIVSFMYTRCPDPHICSLVSAKFAWLESRIDPATMRLVEVTLDPAFDTPPVLKRYGTAFGASPQRWTLATGSSRAIDVLSRRMGIVATRGPASTIVHSDSLIVLDPGGRIASRVDGTAWTPDQAIALAQGALHQRSNPLVRIALALASGVSAVCGGGTSGITLAGAIVIFLGLVAVLAFVVFRSFGRALR